MSLFSATKDVLGCAFSAPKNVMIFSLAWELRRGILTIKSERESSNWISGSIGLLKWAICATPIPRLAPFPRPSHGLRESKLAHCTSPELGYCEHEASPLRSRHVALPIFQNFSLYIYFLGLISLQPFQNFN